MEGDGGGVFVVDALALLGAFAQALLVLGGLEKRCLIVSDDLDQLAFHVLVPYFMKKERNF